jgi:hypothetical protein
VTSQGWCCAQERKSATLTTVVFISFRVCIMAVLAFAA